MFQSTPVIADGRTHIRGPKQRKAQEFQSTPVIADGRTGAADDVAHLAPGFNPRPSSLTGEPIMEDMNEGEQGVSIHARHR